MKINKINKLRDGRQLFAFWANNRGRGQNNCTLQIVPETAERPVMSKMTRGVISSTQTSSWNGNVNISCRVCEKLGISKDDIVVY
jgi:hypothetical protein